MKSEIELSEELGMDRRTIREMRMNALSADLWTKLGNRIVYTAEGEHALRNQIQKSLSSDELPEPVVVNESRTLKISKIPLNPNIVICDDIRVRVRSNKNFLKGMELKARPPAGDGRVWVMLGRCPRWRGKY